MILQHPHNYQSQLSIMKKILNFVLTIVSSKVCVIAKYCIVFFLFCFMVFYFAAVVTMQYKKSMALLLLQQSQTSYYKANWNNSEIICKTAVIW